ncbi:hypothetical protein GW17_00056775 [Ensete ventricosum]|uniref:Uncharacterized protein n=1 Tax=Ensete ventricosum TaxID=4639 RepID=A0A426Y0X0_ENSVE|nr:hypothetical protein B296_00023153 [Ensete ventricosum]RWV81776.1 hypothetical protein GW17_00056775 [Ensete ventricosum]RZS20207.1 hypothetical protein BHM03_00052701 [Ensete ventricosum]
MSLHRCKAVFIGLFEAGRVNEWVVTEKLGKTLKTKQVSAAAKRSPSKFWQRLMLNLQSCTTSLVAHRFLFLELGMAVVLLMCACYNFFYRSNQYFIFIVPLSLSFFLMGFGFVGTHIPAAK